MLSPEINYAGKIKKVKSSTAKKSIFFCPRQDIIFCEPE